MTEASEHFNLQTVLTQLNLCIAQPGVSVRHYINAYRELDKIFYKLGKIFHFIAHDVEEKIGILEAFLLGEDQLHYQTVQEMLAYEKKEQLLFKSDFVSGSRTLLRLHRALEFLVKFIDGVHKSEENAKMSQLSKDVYDTTLGRFHPWLVRKGAHLAFYVLPYRSDLICTFGGSIASATADEIMQKTVQSGQVVYSSVQKFYAEQDLLELP